MAFAWINGDLNEDEAFRNAIAASLEDSRRAPAVSSSGVDNIIVRSRKVVDLTDKIEEKMVRLSKMKFPTRLEQNEIPQLPRIKELEPQEAMNATQRLRRQQDAEYEAALAQAQAQQEAEEQEHHEEEHEEEIEAPQEEYSGMLAARVAALAPEPEAGLTIAIQLSNTSRFSRRFVEDVKGDEVYVWAASLEPVRLDGFRLGSFDLHGPDGILDPDAPLNSQIQGRRVLFNINSKL